MRDRVRELSLRISDIEIKTEAYYRYSYNYDATGKRGNCLGVVFPRGLKDLSSIIRESSRMEVPFFLRGAGTGFSGGAVPEGGGIVISTEKMRRILRLDGKGGTVEVEAGLVNNRLQEFLEPEGWFYPPDPASMNVSTIGGNIAENAGGPRAYKYGVTRRYLRSLTWITSEGDVIESPVEGPAALLPGSEGTLGAVYSAILSILPLPEAYATSIVVTETDEEAMEVASDLLATGFFPSVMEFIDSKTMRCVSRYLGTDIFDYSGSYLFFEVDGSGPSVKAQQSILESFCLDRRLQRVTASDDDEREILWELRRSISPSLARQGITKVNEDIAVPLGSLKHAVSFIHAAASDLGLDCYLFGHCGDGNLHVNIMTDRRRKEEMERTSIFVEKLFSETARIGGTLSGEHGIGITKSGYLDKVYSAAEIGLQKRIKGIFDSGGFLNPGKYFSS